MVDLLGRKEIEQDRSSISRYLFGKKVLVTGAGGSIGSELVRNCLTFDPDLLVLFDQSEHNLFKMEKECSQSKHPVAFQPILGDIRDKTLLHRVFSSFRPDVVFHAAAYKHVPMQEEHPWEAVFTNIHGTMNLMDASEDYGVDRFVLVSTDKAVNPVNVMGATKRAAEKLIQSISDQTKTTFIAVRFGNVLGSSGRSITFSLSDLIYLFLCPLSTVELNSLSFFKTCSCLSLDSVIAISSVRLLMNGIMLRTSV